MTATITFSIEIELGWGVVQDNNLEVLTRDRTAESVALRRLLNLCDELKIPVTFNIVGHLLRDTPLESYDGGHEDGWFNDIPMTGPEDAPLFYAPGLVRQIQSSSIDHEICTHTFTHVECANSSTETLQWEFDKVMKTHDEFGLEDPVSLVPPRHSPPPDKILRQYNIEIVRSSRAEAPGLRPASNRAKLAVDVLTGARAQPHVQPQIRNGIVRTYCTKFPTLSTPLLQSGQKAPHPIFRTLPEYLRKKIHSYNLLKTLSVAIQRESYTHFWSHLWETAGDVQWPQIRDFLSKVAYNRDNDNIDIETMKGINQKIRTY